MDYPALIFILALLLAPFVAIPKNKDVKKKTLKSKKNVDRK